MNQVSYGYVSLVGLLPSRQEYYFHGAKPRIPGLLIRVARSLAIMAVI